MGKVIILVASYNVGPEYEAKLAQAQVLRQNGFDVKVRPLFDLVDGMLPKYNVENLIFQRLASWAEYEQPQTLAFHAGMSIRLKSYEFAVALERFRARYPGIECILEPRNWYRDQQSFEEPEVKYFARKIPDIFDSNPELTKTIWPQ